MTRPPTFHDWVCSDAKCDFGYHSDRGSLYRDLGMELADCAIYLSDLAAILGYDLDAEIEAKRAVLIDRWGDPS